jgi:hypothetical protein
LPWFTSVEKEREDMYCLGYSPGITKAIIVLMKAHRIYSLSAIHMQDEVCICEQFTLERTEGGWQ